MHSDISDLTLHLLPVGFKSGFEVTTRAVAAVEIRQFGAWGTVCRTRTLSVSFAVFGVCIVRIAVSIKPVKF